MGPPKRKGSVRRQVLDLNAGEDSPSRPTWQSKYQNVLPKDFDQNGDSQSSLPAQNPLSGLLGNYNSDSDSEEAQKPNSSLDAKVEDFLKEIQSISTETSEKDGKVAQNSQEEMPYPPSATAWQQCFDPNSGYPYYWNTETNEVTWEMPTNLKTVGKQPKPEVKKTICKYPWQTESDSEDEKSEVPTVEKKFPEVSKIDTIAPAPEVVIENAYETSPLVTHGVQDRGPPGEENIPTKEPVSSTKEEFKLETPEESKADDVMAQIEKETPPDYKEKSQTTGIALIANYGDDSESEDNTVSEKRKILPTKPLFPIEIPEETSKPLFPCMETPKPQAEPQSQDESETFSNIYNADVEDPAAQKAFKRKKRFEFATTVFSASTSKTEVKTGSPERSVPVPTTQYNLDPNANDHHGFGFKALKAQSDPEKKSYKTYGGIQFVKAETINLSEPKPTTESESESGSPPKLSTKEPVIDEEIQDAATLLREKVTFLTRGTDSISPIEHMAIELETLVLAWQEGALTPPYLLRWLKEKCSELLRHEMTAAPSGWTCLWDRKSKRYFYRNTTTKTIQWEYPNVEEKTKGEVEGAGDEMDICDTPPHSSPTGQERVTDETPATPPPPVISDRSSSPTLQPPPPPQISFADDGKVKKKKRKAEETIEDEGSSKGEKETPPLPPMPPPPPPPPDESPPPLPDSPPPLQLDQPLPPGVDEPEYTLYRTSKHSFKKTQPESAAYSTDLMMTYSYGLPVQQVVSSNGQPMAVQMQPLEYHTYLHEPVTNPYIVQSAPTSHVIHCPAKKPKPSLTSELVSFYSDIAMLDTPREESSSPAPSALPAAPVVMPTVEVTKPTENVTSNGVNAKKKKTKAKTASGLSLKKKGVSSLVAKWQQVQQEVRKDFSDDDDDDDASSTK